MRGRQTGVISTEKDELDEELEETKEQDPLLSS